MPLNGFRASPTARSRRRVLMCRCELRQGVEDVIARALLENTRAVFGITL